MSTINAVMLVKNRLRLTCQALRTFVLNTDTEWTMTLIDDGSQLDTSFLCQTWTKEHLGKTALLRNEMSHGFRAEREESVLGGLKNLGVYWSERRFGRGDWLVLLDNDTYFTPGWASIMIETLELLLASPFDCNRFELLGGQNHPYHQTINNKMLGDAREYLAVAGTCWMMPWSTWDKHGPLVETGAPGPGQSEDSEYCQRIRAAGGRVGAIWPHVVLDTGITQTGGTLSVGADIKQRVEGVLYQ